MTEKPEAAAVSEFLRLACLRYDASDDPANWAKAQAMLEARPALAVANVYTAAVLGDASGLRRRLDRAPVLANAKGGPLDWPPLLYLAYSRVVWDGRPCDWLAAAQALLDRGADANAFFWWGETYRFTAITGALGEGEGGPRAQPPHPRGLDLARLLLEAGADPNDGQALYNRMLRPGDDCLRMLLEYGLNARHRVNWQTDNPMGMLDYLLWHALKGGNADRARLLLDHGANPNVRPEGGLSVYRIALRHGQPELAAMLAEAGAAAEATAVDRFLCACMVEDVAAARALVEGRPGLLDELTPVDREVLHLAAANDLRESASLLLGLGFDVNARETAGYRHAPLHKAAMNGHLEMAVLLVSCGADPEARDAVHQDTPAGWARYHGQQSAAHYLAGLVP